MAISKKQIKTDYGLYIKQCSRKSSKRNGHDPNDRQYDRKLERKIKNMSPLDIQALLDE